MRQSFSQDLSNIARILGTENKLSALQNGNVNKYARYKGVDSSKTSALTEEEFLALNYGLTVSNQTLYEGGKSITQIMRPAWTIVYNPPMSVRRLSDWAGYAPSASFPVKPLTASSVKAYSDGTMTIVFGTGENPTGSVPMQCFLPQSALFLNKYIGLMMQYTNGSAVTTVLYSEAGYINDDYELQKSSFTFKMPVTGTYLNDKNWTVYICLFNEIIHDSSDAKKGIFGSAIAGLQSSIKWLPFPQSESILNIKLAVFDDYLSLSSSASPYSSSGRYYARVIIVAKSVLGTESVSISGTIAGVSKSASSYSTNGTASTTWQIDVSITAVVYNSMLSNPSNYSYSLNCNITSRSVSKTISGNFTSR